MKKEKIKGSAINIMLADLSTLEFARGTKSKSITSIGLPNKTTKMKRVQIVIIFLIAIVSFTNAQEPIEFQEVIKLDSTLTKDDLYNRGHNWIVSIFKNSQKVIQLNDRERGQIICKGNFEYNQTKFIWGGSETTKGHINFTIKIFFKEGRYKYVITDFIHEPLSKGNSFGLITTEEEYSGKMFLTSKKWRKWIWNDIKEQIELNVKVMQTSLVEEMGKKGDLEDDNW